MLGRFISMVLLSQKFTIAEKMTLIMTILQEIELISRDVVVHQALIIALQKRNGIKPKW